MIWVCICTWIEAGVVYYYMYVHVVVLSYYSYSYMYYFVPRRILSPPNLALASGGKM